MKRLTEKEKVSRNFMKKVLTIGKEFEETVELEKAIRYHMPQDSKNVCKIIITFFLT